AFGRRGLLRSWRLWADMTADLPHYSRYVHAQPALDDLVVRDAHDADPRVVHHFAGRRDPRQRALVGAAQRQAGGEPCARGHDVLDGGPDVGERGAYRRGTLLKSRESAQALSGGDVVVEEVEGDQVVGALQVAGIEYLIDPTVDECVRLLCGHGITS